MNPELQTVRSGIGLMWLACDPRRRLLCGLVEFLLEHRELEDVILAAVKAVGAVLLVLPHAIGAPHPAEHAGLAPVELEQAFIYTALVTNAIYWIVLGALAGYFFDRFGRDREGEGAMAPG